MRGLRRRRRRERRRNPFEVHAERLRRLGCDESRLPRICYGVQCCPSVSTLLKKAPLSGMLTLFRNASPLSLPSL